MQYNFSKILKKCLLNVLVREGEERRGRRVEEWKSKNSFYCVFNFIFFVYLFFFFHQGSSRKMAC